MTGIIAEKPVQLTFDEAALISACLEQLTVVEARELAKRIRREFLMSPAQPAVREVTDDEARHLFGLPPLPEIKSEGW